MTHHKHHLPNSKGAYIIYASLAQDVTLTIGALGKMIFFAGSYAYVGSAMGSGGIRARVNHHLTPSPRPHWHFDHLKPHLTIQAVLWQTGTDRWECEWVRQLLTLPEVTAPIAGFGASDCKSHCPAHLLFTQHTPSAIAQHLQIQNLYEFMYNNEALPPI